MTTQTFHLFTEVRGEVRKSYLGSRTIPQWADLGAGARPVTSYAFFCPWCQRVWGMMIVDTSKYCQCTNQACKDHATFPSDGTFTRPFADPEDPRGTHDLPLDALRHDVEALCQFYLTHPQQLKLFNYV